MRKTIAIVAGLAVLGLANFSIYSRERLIADLNYACHGPSSRLIIGWWYLKLPEGGSGTEECATMIYC